MGAILAWAILSRYYLWTFDVWHSSDRSSRFRSFANDFWSVSSCFEYHDLSEAPVVGITAHYWSWRAVHYSLAASGFGALVCIFFFFPETSHPNSRGIDEYRKAGKALPKWRPVILNPLSQLLMLRSPILLFMVYCFPFYHCQSRLIRTSSPSSPFSLSWLTSVSVYSSCPKICPDYHFNLALTVPLAYTIVRLMSSFLDHRSYCPLNLSRESDIT